MVLTWARSLSLGSLLVCLAGCSETKKADALAAPVPSSEVAPSAQPTVEARPSYAPSSASAPAPTQPASGQPAGLPTAPKPQPQPLPTPQHRIPPPT